MLELRLLRLLEPKCPVSPGIEGHPWPALPAVACFVEKLGHLCSLPTAGLTTHNDNGVLSHRLHDGLLFSEDRELEPLLLWEKKLVLERRAQRAGEEVPHSHRGHAG